MRIISIGCKRFKLRGILVIATVLITWVYLTNKTHRSFNQSQYMSQRKSRRQPVYRFVINHPDSCTQKNISLAIVVHSSATNSRRRENVRRTWGTVRESNGVRIGVYFMLGMRTGQQKRIVEENRLYKDIIQQNFEDSYRNLTLKNRMAMQWASTYCKTAKFIIKMDDDVMVDPYHVTRFLKEKEWESPTDFLYCHVFYYQKPHRWHCPPWGKWALTYEEYPDDNFPPFCKGAAYILSPDVPAKLWKASFELPILHIDDMFMTGLVTQLVNITPQQWISPHRMYVPLSRAYRSYIGIHEAIFFVTESWIQRYNWDYVWHKIVEYETGTSAR